jgi:hypothetical protein
MRVPGRWFDLALGNRNIAHRVTSVSHGVAAAQHPPKPIAHSAEWLPEMFNELFNISDVFSTVLSPHMRYFCLSSLQETIVEQIFRGPAGLLPYHLPLIELM